MKPHYVLLTLVYCAGLFWLSSGANPIHVKPVFPGEDKIVHACLYAGLAWVVSMGLRKSGRTYAPWVLFLAPILFAALYGVTDEFHQRFVPGRTCDVWDWTADTCGAVMVQIAIYYIGPVVSRGRTR